MRHLLSHPPAMQHMSAAPLVPKCTQEAHTKCHTTPIPFNLNISLLLHMTWLVISSTWDLNNWLWGCTELQFWNMFKLSWDAFLDKLRSEEARLWVLREIGMSTLRSLCLNPFYPKCFQLGNGMYYSCKKLNETSKIIYRCPQWMHFLLHFDWWKQLPEKRQTFNYELKNQSQLNYKYSKRI